MLGFAFSVSASARGQFMDSEPEDRFAPKSEINFPNGNRAFFIRSRSNAGVGALLSALQIKKPRSLLVLIGGADELDQNLTSQLEQLFAEASPKRPRILSRSIWMAAQRPE
jgi:hypothetical protein